MITLSSIFKRMLLDSLFRRAIRALFPSRCDALLPTLSSWQRRLIIWCEPIIRVDTSERRHHPQPHPLAPPPHRKLTGSAFSLTVHFIQNMANNMLCHPAPHSTATNIFAILRVYLSYPRVFSLLYLCLYDVMRSQGIFCTGLTE